METRFFSERSWRWPWQDRLKPLQPEQAADQVERGRAVLAQPPDSELPLPVKSAHELSLASGSGPPELSEMARQGFRFQAQVGGVKACVGVYGAYLALTPGSGVDQLELLDPRSQLPIPAARDELSRVSAYYGRENPLESQGYTFWDRDGVRIASYLAGPGQRIGREHPWFELDGNDPAPRLEAMHRLLEAVPLSTATRALPEYLAGGALVDCARTPEEQVALAGLALEHWPELHETAARLSPQGRVELIRLCPDGKLRPELTGQLTLARDVLAVSGELPDWKRRFLEGLAELDPSTQKLALKELSAETPQQLGRALVGVSRQLRAEETSRGWQRAADLGKVALERLQGLKVPTLANPGSTVTLCETALEHTDEPEPSVGLLATQAVREQGYPRSWEDAVLVGRMYVDRLAHLPAPALALAVDDLKNPGSYTRLYEGVLKSPEPADLGALAADLSQELRGAPYQTAWQDAQTAGQAFVGHLGTPSCQAARRLGKVTNPGSAVLVYEGALRSPAATSDDLAALGLELSQKVRAKEDDGYPRAWWDAAAAGRAFLEQLADDSAACRAALQVETTHHPGSLVAVYEGALAEPRAEAGALGRKLSQVVREKPYPSRTWEDAVKVGRGFVQALSQQPGPALALKVDGLVNPGSYVMTYEATLDSLGRDATSTGSAAVSAVLSRGYQNISLEGLKVAEVFAGALPPDSQGRLLDRVSASLSPGHRLAFLREALELPAPAAAPEAAERVLEVVANLTGMGPGQADQVAREALTLLRPQVEDPALVAYLDRGIGSTSPGEPVRILDMLANVSFFKPSATTVVEREDHVQILGSRVKVRKPQAVVADPGGSAGQVRSTTGGPAPGEG